MGPLPKLLIIFLITTMTLPTRSQEASPGFREVDSTTYDLYQAGKWEELADYGRRAVREGFDYYFLRMRTGIAWFERKNYLQAVKHFQEALALASNDPVALEYLLGCYLELNKTADALESWQQLPAPVKVRLQHIKPRMVRADLSIGPLFSDQGDQFNSFDLDGNQDIYGEADLLTGGYNFYAGLSKIFHGGFSVFGGYTLIKQDKNKLVQIADTLSVDDQYTLHQHQFYLSGSIPLMKNLSITPALNYVRDQYNVVMPVYHENTETYSFPVDSVRMDAFIGYLAITRDFHMVKTGLFAAWSNLNEREQFQAGFHLLAYPFGNLNFYLSSRLMNHRNNGYNHLIFEQMAGIRLFKPLWAEANMTVGEMRNYHDNNAYVVYNLTDRMKFKGGGKLILNLAPRWMLTTEYVYLLRSGSYILYEKKTEDSDEVVGITMPENFNNHLVVITLSGKF